MDRYLPVIYGEPTDRPDDQESVETSRHIAGVLERLGYISEPIAVGLDLRLFEKIAAQNPVCVFNLVDSIGGDGRIGHIACAALEHYGLPFTGSGTAAYYQSTSKLLTKAVFGAAGLPTTEHWLHDAPGDCLVIVKSVYEHASYGMDQGSIVPGRKARAEIAAREEKFGGTFFCEEYIEGREFNVSVLEGETGPKVLPIPEISFDTLPEGLLPIVDYAAKWDPSHPAYHNTPRQFGLEESEPELATRLAKLTRATWDAAGLMGYARVDFRVGEDDGVYILEFNANPCLAPDAGFAAALKAAGMTYDEGIAAIVAAAMRKRRR